MNYIRLNIALVSILSIIACGSPEAKELENRTTTLTKKNEEHAEIGVVEMNDGKRWKANSETTTGIMDMMQIMDAFDDIENPKAYQDLSDSLNTTFKLIFKNCTMKGDAHDQLHNYLFPMVAQFKKLSSEDLEECKTTFTQLRADLNEYSSYFE